HAAMGEELARVQAERIWLERVARLALVVRDMTRAPLESMRSALSTLQRGPVAPSSAMTKIEEAVTRFGKLNDTLPPLDGLMPGGRAAASFEAMAGLHAELRESRPQAPSASPVPAAPAPTPAEESRRALLALTSIGIVALSLTAIADHLRHFSIAPIFGPWVF